jgi:hypothetical protein
MTETTLKAAPACQATEERKLALVARSALAALVTPVHSRLAAQIEEADLDVVEKCLANTFEPKSTATLVKRGGSMSAYVAWAKSAAVPAFPLSEAVVHRHVGGVRRDGAPPSGASSFLEAVGSSSAGARARGCCGRPASAGQRLRPCGWKRMSREAPPFTTRWRLLRKR